MTNAQLRGSALFLKWSKLKLNLENEKKKIEKILFVFQIFASENVATNCLY